MVSDIKNLKKLFDQYCTKQLFNKIPLNSLYNYILAVHKVYVFNIKVTDTDIIINKSTHISLNNFNTKDYEEEIYKLKLFNKINNTAHRLWLRTSDTKYPYELLEYLVNERYYPDLLPTPSIDKYINIPCPELMLHLTKYKLFG